MNSEILYEQESFRIIGICMEIYRILGKGFLEAVYKDALEYELKTSQIPFQRETQFLIKYKEIILKHRFCADFVLYEKILLEIKCGNNIIDQHVSKTLNYLKASELRLGMIINFGEDSLKFKRLIF